MRWHRQVLHVARKDVRLTRWMLLLYALVVAAATAAAVEWPLGFAELVFPWVLLVTLLAVLLGAVFVQADSPSRSDAFWVTRPLDPSAVFGAKLLLAAVVLAGAPLIGQLATLLAHGLAPADILRPLGRAALSLGVLLATTAVIAALTRDLRTFLLVVVVWLIAINVVSALVMASLRVQPGEADIPSWPQLLSLLFAGALVAHQYSTRNVRRGVALLLLLLLGQLASGLVAQPSQRPAAREVPDELRTVRLRVESARLNDVAGVRTVRLGIALEGAQPRYQYWLLSASLRLDARIDSTVIMTVSPVRLNEPQLITAGVSWRAARPAGVFRHDLSFPLSDAQAAVLAGSGGGVTLEAHIELREARELMRLPVERGAAAARDGDRFRITSVQLPGGRPLLGVRHSMVSALEGWSHPFESRETIDYALWHEERSELIALDETSGSGSGLVFVVMTSGPMARSWNLTAREMTVAEPVDSNWLARARLVIVKWLPLGSHPVRASARVSP